MLRYKIVASVVRRPLYKVKALQELKRLHNNNSQEYQKNERDICVACNWDLEQIVEFGDAIEV